MDAVKNPNAINYSKSNRWFESATKFLAPVLVLCVYVSLFEVVKIIKFIDKMNNIHELLPIGKSFHFHVSLFLLLLLFLLLQHRSKMQKVKRLQLNQFPLLLSMQDFLFFFSFLLRLFFLHNLIFFNQSIVHILKIV